MTPLPTFALQSSGVVSVLEQLAPWLALGIGVYWLYTLFRRTFVSSADPRYRKSTSSMLGSGSILISGAYFSAIIAVVLAVLTWPLVLESTLVAGGLIGGVAFHSLLEYEEATE